MLILARQEAALQARQAVVRCFKRIRAERPARRRTAAASALAPLFDLLHRGLRLQNEAGNLLLPLSGGLHLLRCVRDGPELAPVHAAVRELVLNLVRGLRSCRRHRHFAASCVSCRVWS